MYTAAMKTSAVALAAILLIVMTLGGCLLTVGAPLVRKVEPDRLVLEAGGGAAMAGSPSTFGAAGYAYVGRSLGRHFEIGILPTISSFGVDGEPSWSITLPVKWDPFPYEWPAHLVVFAGPAVAVFGGTYGVIVAGTGVSWTATKWLEAYAVASVSASGDLNSLAGVTASAGARFLLSPSIELGAGLTYTNPGPATAMAALTVRTQSLLSGYGF